MSYKDNNKSTGKFEGYKDNKSNMISSDAINAVGSSHIKMDKMMEAGTQIGEAISAKYNEHKEAEFLKDALDVQPKTKGM